MSDETDIAGLSGECVEKFERLVESLAKCPQNLRLDMPPEEITNESGRFSIWCGNLGALQRGHSSLEVRLRSSVVMRSTVIKFLTQLRDCLEQSLEITTGSRVPWEDEQIHEGPMSEPGLFAVINDDESASSDEDYRELTVCRTEIQGAVTHLLRLSFKMRNANYRSLSTKALSTKILDPDSGFDLFQGYAKLDLQYVADSLRESRKGILPPAVDGQTPQRTSSEVPRFLLDRLSRAITNRRRYFAYWRRHSIKLQRGTNDRLSGEIDALVSRKFKLEVPSTKSGPRGDLRSNTASGTALLRPPETIFSVTDVSKYRRDLDRQDRETVISYATTAQDINGHSAPLPKAPLDAESKAAEFVCPYCCVLCPAEQGKGKGWRAHILQDLQAYVCTFPSCPEGDNLYPSRGAWIEHERLCHRRIWRCFDEQHSEAQYSSEERLQLHLLEHHKDLDEGQIQLVLKRTETTVADTRDICPFCNTSDFKNGLFNHMAFHQEKLAARAMPRILTGDEDNDIASKAAQDNESKASLKSVSLRFSDKPPSDTNSEQEVVWDELEVMPKTKSMIRLQVLTDQSSSAAIGESFHDSELLAAVHEGISTTVESLLRDGASANAKDEEYGNVLQAASFWGHLEIVKLLLDHGADANTHAGLYGYALRAAASVGHESVIQILLDRGADINAHSEGLDSALITAVSKGHKGVAKILLDHGAQIDGKHGNALGAAVSEGQTAIVSLLLERGADIDADCGRLGTALGVAASEGDLELLDLLLDSGADINKQFERYGTALGVALFHDMEAAFEFLLRKGADINVEGGDFSNALGSAAYAGNKKAVETLLAKGAIIQTPGKWFASALAAAAAGGSREIIQLLLDSGADIHAQGGAYGNALGAAAVDGSFWIVELLLEKGADITTATDTGKTPLHLASTTGRLRVVKLLLEHGADINARDRDGYTPLLRAVDGGHSEVATYLVEQEADFTLAEHGGFSPTILAANKGYLDLVRVLLERGADWTATTNDGWTAINSASCNGHLEVVKLLLDKGLPAAPQKDGWTPLLSAASNGHFEIAKLLLQNGADKAAVNSSGWSALGQAANWGHIETVELLLEQGADVSIATDLHWTPLHAAADRGYIEIVEILLEAGSDLNAQNKYGWTAVSAAADSGHTEVVKFLVDKGADLSSPAFPNVAPLRTACLKGHIKIAQYLLDHGAYHLTNGLDHQHGSLANLLAFQGHIGLLRYIVKHENADLRVTDFHQRNALHWAVRGGSVNCFHYVMSKGLELSNPTTAADNLANLAASGGSVELLRLIHDKDARPVQKASFWNALHWACRSGKMQAVELLIERGMVSRKVAVPELPGEWSPIDIAVFHGNAASLEKLSKSAQTALGAVADESGVQGRQNGSILCDGCAHEIYGPAFTCLTCVDFDYCFMCKSQLDYLHESHGWERKEVKADP